MTLIIERKWSQHSWDGGAAWLGAAPGSLVDLQGRWDVTFRQPALYSEIRGGQLSGRMLIPDIPAIAVYVRLHRTRVQRSSLMVGARTAVFICEFILFGKSVYADAAEISDILSSGELLEDRQRRSGKPGPKEAT